MIITDLVKSMLTESDGKSYCPVRVASTLTAVAYHIAAIAGITIGDIRLDITTLGHYLTQMCILIGAGGFSIGAKSALKGDAPI